MSFKRCSTQVGRELLVCNRKTNSQTNLSQPSTAADLQVDTCGVMMTPSRPLLRFSAQIAGFQGIVMVDSGATADFISQSFIDRNRLPSIPLVNKRTILLADGSKHSVSRQAVSLSIPFPGFTGVVTPHILPLHEYDVILGMPWLWRYNPQINWRTRTVSFTSSKQQHSAPPR